MKNILFILLLSFVINSGAYEITSDIISNNMYIASGVYDTVIIGTSHGILFTENFSAEIPSWKGIRGISAFYDAVYKNGKLILTSPGILTDDYYNLLKVKIIDPYTGNDFDISFDYNVLLFTEDFNFLPTQIVNTNNGFFIAATDGGIIRIDNNFNFNGIYYPGEDKKSFLFNEFTPKLTGDKHNPQKRIEKIAVNNSAIYVLCDNTLWKFDTDSSTWNIIADSSYFVKNNQQIFAYTMAEYFYKDGIEFFIAAKSSQDTLTSLIYKFDFIADSLEQLPFKFDGTVTLKVDKEKSLYIFTDKANLIEKIVVDSSGNFVKQYSSSHFTKRISSAEGGFNVHSLYDIYMAYNDSQKLFGVLTDYGFFYSLDEDSDEISEKPFNHIWRSPQIKSGLKESYAYPGIINSSNTKAIFAYNLEKDDRVTIDIYDYNMDHVLRIIDNELRKAGKFNSSGRSTDPSRDYWDGSYNNRGGEIVAPGVYYYKIKTEKGYRSFGKIIVAKN